MSIILYMIVDILYYIIIITDLYQLINNFIIPIFLYVLKCIFLHI
jgi:hypothetical protein